jgi:hypothetical protein
LQLGVGLVKSYIRANGKHVLFTVFSILTAVRPKFVQSNGGRIIALAWLGSDPKRGIAAKQRLS